MEGDVCTADESEGWSLYCLLAWRCWMLLINRSKRSQSSLKIEVCRQFKLRMAGVQVTIRKVEAGSIPAKQPRKIKSQTFQLAAGKVESSIYAQWNSRRNSSFAYSLYSFEKDGFYFYPDILVRSL